MPKRAIRFFRWYDMGSVKLIHFKILNILQIIFKFDSMFCRECGKENPDTYQNCGSCGACLIKKSLVRDSLICHYCLCHNLPNVTHCLRCGTKLKDPHSFKVSWDLIKWLVLYGLLIIIILQLSDLTVHYTWGGGGLIY